MMRILFTCSLMISVFTVLESQDIVIYPEGSLTPSYVHPNVTVSNITLGPGLTQISCTSTLLLSHFNQPTLSAAYSNGQYIEFTITPNPGFQMNVNRTNIINRTTNLPINTTPLERFGFTHYYNNTSYEATYQTASHGIPMCGSGGGNINNLIQNYTTSTPVTVRMAFFLYTTNLDAKIGQITISGNVALPIKISSINVKKDKVSNIFTFTTTSEINNTGFEIERSADGINFDKIGWVDGSGNSFEEKHYQFIDEKPLPGINYYRLKQVDMDGRYEYSEVVSTAFNPSELHFVQNYASSEINVLGIEGVGDFNIYNGGGQLIKSGSTLDNTIDISELREGLYTLSMSHQGQIISHKFVKL